MTRARKRFGQHFLEPAWVDKLIRVIDPQPDETFIEIGPGRGALTRPLAARAKQVIAYEIDRDLAADLRATMPSNVTIHVADFLAPSNPEPQIPNPSSVRVAANLPYNVASPILFKLIALFDAGLPIRDATVMLQREVADRLVARPGTKDYGPLGILVRHSASVERVLNLPPGAFRPVPKVQSSVVRLQFHAPDPLVRDRHLFQTLVQAVFTRRRKTMANAIQGLRLASEAGVGGGGQRSVSDVGSRCEGQRSGSEPGIRHQLPGWLDGRRRPETLTLEEFARLADVFSSP